MSNVINLSEYRDWLRDLKQQIKTGQMKAVLSVNSQMIMLYWDMGRQIAEKQEHARWGSGFIEQLSKDLREEFPDERGFSVDNLAYMKRFFLFYTKKTEQLVRETQCPVIQEDIISEQAVRKLQPIEDKKERSETVSHFVQQFQQMQVSENQQDVIWKQLVSKLVSIPWGHHIKIMQKVKDLEPAIFYINKTIENNWSRSVLEYHIETNLFGNQGKAITNFSLTLPSPQGDLANELMKSPYNFAFIRMSEKAKELDLEKALVGHISQFLLELGVGFAYMGRQFPLKVGKKEYRTDLLFYHTRLRCYVVIELKTKEFEPEFVGKLNFYITAINELIKNELDNPTIGMLLCKDKDNYAVEFSLKDINNPIGVSSFHYTELADDIKAALPSAEKIQTELLKCEQEHEKRKSNY